MSDLTRILAWAEAPLSVPVRPTSQYPVRVPAPRRPGAPMLTTAQWRGSKGL